MGEKRYLYLNIVLSIIIFFLAFQLVNIQLPKPIIPRSLEISYKADINLDTNIVLNEAFIYKVNKEGKYRMLYRYWKIPLFFNYSRGKREGEIVIKNISYNGQNYYVKDYNGRVYLYFDDGISFQLVKTKAYNNEIGLIDPNYFDRSTYILNYTAILIPPIDKDSRYAHLNLKLVDKHQPYKEVYIRIRDPGQRIIEISPHFSCKIERKGDSFFIESSSPKNGLIEIEMLLDASKPLIGVEKNIPNVYDRFISSNKGLSFLLFLKKLSLSLSKIGLLILFLFPFFLIFLYYRYGKEKQVVVPENISFVPRRRKPWLVNMVFHRDAKKTDINALNATLLDLYRRKIIDIQPYKVNRLLGSSQEVKIRILRGNNLLDEYEKKVLDFIKKYSINGFFDTREVKKMKNQLELRKCFEQIYSYTNKPLLNEFIENKARRYLTIISVASLLLGVFILFFSSISIYGFKMIESGSLCILSFALWLSSTISLCLPYQVFGRWRNDFYREKLEWDSFARFLKSLTTMDKKVIQDISIWKEWLVYGTALGVGKEVEKALKNLNIDIDELRVYPALYISMRGVSATLNSSRSHGGGFGAGGGFGGGGAGGR
ncbi:DUF2207 domain-containing protein [Candidatus Woesearchaeota archaeon]|nr:DUF2207 domain-containing protein [Candidatus Woesearchaeota archaeon]